LGHPEETVIEREIDKREKFSIQEHEGDSLNQIEAADVRMESPKGPSCLPRKCWEPGCRQAKRDVEIVEISMYIDSLNKVPRP